ncbi:MAG: HlyD family secretion protein [Synechococcales cyanobacterium CRU_2_2]|nr:HlyD family secretion protein [Synechococcales cyanobacterium CRU_2_2]
MGRGLTLTRTRSNYDPSIRKQELELQIVAGHQQVLLLGQALKNTQAEFLKVRAEIQKQQLSQVSAPVNGVLWDLSAQPGQFVQQGDSLGQMMDCEQRWVDAVVDENALGSLQIGTPAEVQLHGADNIVLQGEVSMIRGGVGRLVAGQDVLTPLQRNLPRHTQVRVKLPGQATTALVSDQKVASGNLCYIGYTGRVTFARQGEPQADRKLWSRLRTMAGRLAS